MCTYIHPPGIHANAKLIYADYAIVYNNKKQTKTKQKQTNKRKIQTTQTEQNPKKCKSKNIWAKLQAYIHNNNSNNTKRRLKQIQKQTRYNNNSSNDDIQKREKKWNARAGSRGLGTRTGAIMGR